MALVAPTNDQKAILANNSEFQLQVKFAILANVLYWSQFNIVNFPDMPTAINWVKRRLWAYPIFNNPQLVDNNLNYYVAMYINYLSNYNIVDNTTPGTSDQPNVTIAAMLTNNYFQAISDIISAQLCANIQF